MLMKTLVIAAAVLLSTTANATRFCYYWVDDTGNVETFETPPLDLTAPPFASDGMAEGHLVIGMANKSCRNSYLITSPNQISQAAAAREPIAQPGANISSGIAPIESAAAEQPQLPAPVDTPAPSGNDAPQPVDSSTPTPEPTE